jgi:hypothetical protein
MTRHGPFHYSGSPRDRIRRPHRYYCRAKTPCCHPNALRCLRTSVPSAFLFSLSYLLQVPERRLLCRPGFYGLDPMVTRASFYTMEQRGAPRFLGSPSHAFALLKRPRPRRSAMPLRQSGVAPTDRTAKAATISISRLIHTASALAVYASSFGFPTLARLASGGWQTLTGWDSNPLDSIGEFQAGSPACLFQRPRLSLAPPTSDI